jgi:feruloyl esterase
VDVQSLGVDAAGGSWLGVFRYLVLDDPTWTLDRIDFDRDPDFAERKLAAILTQDDPDLRRFARHGGKLIVYHGWSDDMAPAEPSVDYHAAVTAELGREATDAVMRLYMLPGVDHRRSGPGAGIVLQTEATPAVPATPGRDMLATLQHWVEDGVAPGPFVATKLDAQGQVTRTRLLCPEPQRARYAGSGDVFDAATWTCADR